MSNKIARVKLSLVVLEELLTARNNPFVETDCPQDLKVLKVVADPLSPGCVEVVVSSESSDWPEAIVWSDVPVVELAYTIVDPPPSPTEETEDAEQS